MRTDVSLPFKAIVVFLALAVSAVAQTSDQQSGAWKVNELKSQYSWSASGKDQTLMIVADDRTYKLRSEGVDSQGKPRLFDFAATLDGKDVPAKGLPYGDAVSVRRIDANTIELKIKKDGKVLVTVTSVVSDDGKTRTSTFRGTDGSGHQINNVVVYDKMSIACGPRLCEKQCKGKCGNGANCDCPKK